jgi:hypothetical protein
MNLSLWILLFVALAAAAYFFRAKLGHRKNRKSRTQLEAEKRTARAEADRRDIQNLVAKLSGGSSDAAPAADPKSAPPVPKTVAREAPRPRSRQPVEAAHGFDPDLPARPDPPKPR